MQLLPVLCVPFVAVIQSYRYLNNGPSDILDVCSLFALIFDHLFIKSFIFSSFFCAVLIHTPHSVISYVQVCNALHYINDFCSLSHPFVAFAVLCVL